MWLWLFAVISHPCSLDPSATFALQKYRLPAAMEQNPKSARSHRSIDRTPHQEINITGVNSASTMIEIINAWREIRLLYRGPPLPLFTTVATTTWPPSSVAPEGSVIVGEWYQHNHTIILYLQHLHSRGAIRSVMLHELMHGTAFSLAFSSLVSDDHRYTGAHVLKCNHNTTLYTDAAKVHWNDYHIDLMEPVMHSDATLNPCSAKAAIDVHPSWTVNTCLSNADCTPPQVCAQIGLVYTCTTPRQWSTTPLHGRDIIIIVTGAHVFAAYVKFNK